MRGSASWPPRSSQSHAEAKVKAHFAAMIKAIDTK